MDMNTERLITWLPRLRRYAHALTGGREHGDAYVSACIEVVREDPIDVADDDEFGQELFCLFQEIWSLIDHVCAPPVAGDGADANLKRLLAELPSLDRAAVLLAAFEGFTPSEIGGIVGLPAEQVSYRLGLARERLRAGAGARVLIIEDRPRLAESMSEMIGALGHTVVGVAAREGDAVEIAAAEPPELLVADMELGVSEDRMATVHRVLDSVAAPVIFLTGAPELFWTRPGFEAAIIVSKPVDKWSLQAAIGQALASGAPRPPEQ